jgi:hypothetical protein
VPNFNSQMLGETPSAAETNLKAAGIAEIAAHKWEIVTALVIGSTLWWAYQRDKRRGYL